MAEPKNMERIRRGLLWMTAVTAAGALSWCIVAFTGQINNAMLLQQYARQVSKKCREEGMCPAELNRPDQWGRPVLYRRLNSSFLIVSLGRDGIADTDSYETLLNQPPATMVRKDNCIRPSQDTIFLNEHALQACFK